MRRARTGGRARVVRLTCLFAALIGNAACSDEGGGAGLRPGVEEADRPDGSHPTDRGPALDVGALDAGNADADSPGDADSLGDADSPGDAASTDGDARDADGQPRDAGMDARPPPSVPTCELTPSGPSTMTGIIEVVPFTLMLTINGSMDSTLMGFLDLSGPAASRRWELGEGRHDLEIPPGVYDVHFGGDLIAQNVVITAGSEVAVDASFHRLHGVVTVNGGPLDGFFFSYLRLVRTNAAPEEIGYRYLNLKSGGYDEWVGPGAWNLVLWPDASPVLCGGNIPCVPAVVAGGIDVPGTSRWDVDIPVATVSLTVPESMRRVGGNFKVGLRAKQGPAWWTQRQSYQIARFPNRGDLVMTWRVAPGEYDVLIENSSQDVDTLPGRGSGPVDHIVVPDTPNATLSHTLSPAFSRVRWTVRRDGARITGDALGDIDLHFYGHGSEFHAVGIEPYIMLPEDTYEVWYEGECSGTVPCGRARVDAGLAVRGNTAASFNVTTAHFSGTAQFNGKWGVGRLWSVSLAPQGDDPPTSVDLSALGCIGSPCRPRDFYRISPDSNGAFAVDVVAGDYAVGLNASGCEIACPHYEAPSVLSIRGPTTANLEARTTLVTATFSLVGGTLNPDGERDAGNIYSGGAARVEQFSDRTRVLTFELIVGMPNSFRYLPRDSASDIWPFMTAVPSCTTP